MNNTSTILIVDDDQNSRLILKALLKPQGYHLHFATSGIEALEQASEHSPDLILLDVMMPGLDGFMVCQLLRSNPETAEVPIIMVTALEDRDSRFKGIEAGADDFLTKPIDRLELGARVRTITRINRYRLLLDERRRSEEQAHRTTHELEHAYDTTLEGWARALDLRDKETEGHSRRVTEITVRLARAMGVCEENITHMRRGALLHDIGKLGIPDAILLKPGPLTDEEWAIMRKHPVYAYELLSPIPFLHAALDIPYSHHEKWDGTGYPLGLAGEDIPLAARIFAVVDVWDALSNDRPYRAAFPKDQVREHLQAIAGSHLDPNIVHVFLRLNIDDIRRDIT